MSLLDSSISGAAISNLLNIYTESIPEDFDRALVHLHRGVLADLNAAVNSGDMVREFAAGAIGGDYSRNFLEDAIRKLAYKHGLNAAIFKSGGGSHHVKILTDSAVVTIHTLGDKDNNLSRITEYKKAFSRSNPSYSLGPKGKQPGASINEQGTFLINTETDSPLILPPNVYRDPRVYFTICLPRIFHQRNDMLLIVPDSIYSSSIIEFDYREIRNAGASDMQVTLYTENTVAPTEISLKREQGKKKENTIVPKEVELDKDKKKDGTDKEKG
ncbi:MAG: hypothetical protein AAFV90_24325 [Cyanobacteria bacterium J06634_5]